VRDALGIPGAPTPDLFACRGIVAGEQVASRDQDFRAPVAPDGYRRREGFTGFLPRLGSANRAPTFLARAGIEGEQIGFVRAVLASASVDDDIASVLEKTAGRPFASLDPLKQGPRQCGQLSARVGQASIRAVPIPKAVRIA
jgi:hypothetical protein